MITNLKLALKVLGRRKFFTFISLFGISLTLVVLMVATAIMDNFFAPRAPESRFDRALVIYRLSKIGPRALESSEPGYAFLEQFMRPLHEVERTAIFSNPIDTAIYKGGTRIDTAVKRTDGGYWQILDFQFLEGRAFTEQEDKDGTLVAVISDEMRQKLFGGAPAVGKPLLLEGQTFRIIGVVPRVSLTRIAAYGDVWTPIGSIQSSDYRHAMMGGFNGIVLAKSRADFPRLKREFRDGLRAFPLDTKVYKEVRVALDTPFEAFARLATQNRMGEKAPLVITTVFTVVALLFMTLPALNLITLNLSRILERASEIGVRKAFGASRPKLVAQFIVENVVLTLIGGLAGFALTVFTLHQLTNSGVIPNAVFDVNLRIFVYGMVLAAFFGLFSGVYPAWRMSRLDPVNALRGGGL
jgi:putative ABC transport system permease protein